MDVPTPKRRGPSGRPNPFLLPVLAGLGVVGVLIALKSLGLASPPRPALLVARWATTGKLMRKFCWSLSR